MHGFYHADPHPGNLFALPDGRVGFTDFGRCGTISKVGRDQLADLFMAIIDDDSGSGRRHAPQRRRQPRRHRRRRAGARSLSAHHQVLQQVAAGDSDGRPHQRGPRSGEEPPPRALLRARDAAHDACGARGARPAAGPRVRLRRRDRAGRTQDHQRPPLAPSHARGRSRSRSGASRRWPRTSPSRSRAFSAVPVRASSGSPCTRRASTRS